MAMERGTSVLSLLLWDVNRISLPSCLGQSTTLGDMELGLSVLLSCKFSSPIMVLGKGLMIVLLVEVSVVSSLVFHSDNKIERLVISPDFGLQSQPR